MKRKLKRNRGITINLICKLKCNWLYIAIIIMVAIGVGILLLSQCITDKDIENIYVGLGTGIVTSALVSLYIDAINRKMERNKLLKYKSMLLNPLFNAVKTLYICVALNINEYRVRGEETGYLLLPMEETKKLEDFLKELNEYNMGDIEKVK